AGPGLEGLVERARPVEVLAELHRRHELAGQPGIALEVVVDDRLLEPVEALVVQRVAAKERIAEREPLIEVDHQLDLLAGGLAHRSNRGEIVRETLPSETQLEP